MAKNDHTTFVIELTKKFGQLNDRTFDFQSFDWTVFGQLIITVIIVINKRCLHTKPVTGFAWRHHLLSILFNIHDCHHM